MRSLRDVALLAVAMGAGTWLAGWWAVPLLGAVAGAAWFPERGRAGRVALGAVLAWSVLLVVDALDGRLFGLATMLGGIFPLPGVALLLFTLAFAAAAAWSAAVVASAAVSVARSRFRT